MSKIYQSQIAADYQRLFEEKHPDKARIYRQEVQRLGLSPQQSLIVYRYVLTKVHESFVDGIKRADSLALNMLWDERVGAEELSHV